MRAPTAARDAQSGSQNPNGQEPRNLIAPLGHNAAEQAGDRKAQRHALKSAQGVLRELRKPQDEIEDHLCYIIPQDLRTEPVQKAFDNLLGKLGLTEVQKGHVHAEFWVIFAILVSIGDWDFIVKFMQQYLLRGKAGPFLRDSELPVGSLAGLYFITSEEKRKVFYRAQWMFKPLEIETSPEVQIQEIHSRRRLPWEHTRNNIASGAYGTIDKIKVSKGCLKGHHHNTLGRVSVARKRLHYTSNEVPTLRLLRSETQGHPNILLHLAVLRQPLADAGPNGTSYDEHILFDWAPLGDLEIFLREGHNALGKQIYVFNDEFPHLCPRMSDLLTQARDLAKALAWLHDGAGSHFFAHMDLKPANILVCSPKDPEHPVGVWKLSDFGLSRIGPSQFTSDQDRVFLAGYAADLGDDSFHQHFRGSYSAPRETGFDANGDLSRGADIWSFGCILTELLAFTVGRAYEVDRFRRARVELYEDRSDIFYITYANQPPALKTCVANYLRAHNKNWKSSLCTLIHDMLQVKANLRPLAHKVVTVLDGIVSRPFNQPADVEGLPVITVSPLPPGRPPPPPPRSPSPYPPSLSSSPLSLAQSRASSLVSQAPRDSVHSIPGVLPPNNLPQATIPGKISDWDQIAINLVDFVPKDVQKIRDKNILGLVHRSSSTAPVISASAVNTDGTSVAVLVNNIRIQVCSLNIAAGRPGTIVSIALGTEYMHWDKIQFVGQILCVRGSKNGGGMRIFDVDITRSIFEELSLSHLINSDDAKSSSLTHVAITVRGIIAYNCGKTILVHNIYRNQETQRISADDGYTFTYIAFDQRGARLYAWAFADGGADRLYIWNAQVSAVPVLVKSARSPLKFDSTHRGYPHYGLCPLTHLRCCIVRTSEEDLFVANERTAQAVEAMQIGDIKTQFSPNQIRGLLAANDSCILVVVKSGHKIVLSQYPIMSVRRSVNGSAVSWDHILNGDERKLSERELISSSDYKRFHDSEVSMQYTNSSSGAIVISWPNGLLLILRPPQSRSPSQGSGQP